jgi:hypothetical protein
MALNSAPSTTAGALLWGNVAAVADTASAGATASIHATRPSVSWRERELMEGRFKGVSWRNDAGWDKTTLGRQQRYNLNQDIISPPGSTGEMVAPVPAGRCRRRIVRGEAGRTRMPAIANCFVFCMLQHSRMNYGRPVTSTADFLAGHGRDHAALDEGRCHQGDGAHAGRMGNAS